MKHRPIPDSAWIRAFRSDALTEQGGMCAYCRDPISAGDATADHIKARSRNGGDRRENIAAACEPCNKAKGSMSEAQFKKLLKNPAGAPFAIWLAWSRRRINLAVERSGKRIMRAVGVAT